MLGFDFVLLVLSVWKSVQHYRTLPDISVQWRGAHLMNIMVRDSVLYFFWCVPAILMV